jgi:hypothetical protein
MGDEIEVNIVSYITPSDFLSALRKWNIKNDHSDLNFYIDLFLIEVHAKDKFIGLYRRYGKYLNKIYKQLSSSILFKDIMTNIDFKIAGNSLMYGDGNMFNVVTLTKIEQRFLKRRPSKIIKALIQNKLCITCGKQALYSCRCKLGVYYCRLACDSGSKTRQHKKYCGINI